MNTPSVNGKTNLRDDWNKRAAAVLKSEDLSTLNRVTEDGIVIEPLYLAEDRQESLPDHFSAQAHRGWQITQMIEPCRDTTSLNRMILDELEGGATGIKFSVDQKLDLIPSAIQGVYLDAISVEFDTPSDPIKAQNQLAVMWQDNNIATENGCGHIGYDAFAHSAMLDQPFDESQTASIIETLFEQAQPWAKMGILMVGGAKWHRLGLTPAGQIAACLSEVIALCRISETKNIPLDALILKTRFELAFEADLYQGIAKARAFRLTLGQILSSMQINIDGDLAQQCHAVTAERMLSRIDTDTNILRNGTALLAASLSGFGSITALPHDWLTGSTENGRRIARNMHHLLADEGQLNQIADPAQGSYFIDSLTTSLADKAWVMMQEIEQSGGLAAALSSGLISSWAEASNQSRQSRVNTGKVASLGTTLHPQHNQNIEPLEKGLFGMRGGDHRITAPWEALSERLKGSTYRCLLLDVGGVEAQSHSAAKMKSWFAAARLDATIMKAESLDQALQIIASAKPDVLILGGSHASNIVQDHKSKSRNVVIDIDEVHQHYQGDYYNIMTSIADALDRDGKVNGGAS